MEAVSRVTKKGILLILLAVSQTALCCVPGRGTGSSCITSTRQWALASMAVYDSKCVFLFVLAGYKKWIKVL